MNLIVDTGGTVWCVYGEALDLAELGELTITRASRLEPDESGRWWADLSLMDGPVLGPFDRRSEALAAESQWLEQHWLLGHPA